MQWITTLKTLHSIFESALKSLKTLYALSSSLYRENALSQVSSKRCYFKNTIILLTSHSVVKS